MDIFEMHRSVVDDYRRYVESFLNIHDERIRDLVDDRLMGSSGICPDALVQLNPSFEYGPTVPELVADGVLHPLCSRIFRARDGGPVRLYKHQHEAIAKAREGKPYVVTSGTGSGKSMGYLIPIMDHILRGEPSERRVTAILVYPMNARNSTP